MGYPGSLITNNTPGVDVYPPQPGQAFGTNTSRPTATANPDVPTWFSRVSAELVAIEAKLGLPANPAAGSILASMVTEAPKDGGMYVRQNGLWVPRPTTTITALTTQGWQTWPKPAGATWIKVIAISGGGGGGSGRRSASGTAAAGGQGGTGGSWSIWEGPASVVPATVFLYVSGGGGGGAAVTAADTNGNPGTNGDLSGWGAPDQNSGHFLCYAQGGFPGQGGTTAAAGGPATSAGVFPGAQGGGTSITAAPSVPPYPSIPGTVVAYLGLGAGGGGAGGGISVGAAAFAGAQGGPGPAGARVNGTYQAVAGVVGGNGNAPTDNNAASYLAGFGGSGGGASVTAAVNGGNGGNGSSFGGAGGGGGAALDTAGNSGAGGNGAPGVVLIAVFF
jgi:hypothetical protein